MSDSYSESYEEPEIVFDLSLPDVVDKYKAAGNIANAAMIAVLESIAPGVSVFELCELGDRVMIEQAGQTFKKRRDLKKGVAFPTCISVNNCVGHYSPARAEESIVLQEGDVVKIDLGAHIDGFVSVTAHTTVINSDGGQLGGRVADVVCAAYFASQVAHKLIRPGKTNTEVTNAIERLIGYYDCKPVEGVLSHSLERNVIDGQKCIINRPQVDQIVDEFRFEVNEVYAVDIVVSTGEGKTREESTRTSIYKKTPVPYGLRNNNSKYLLKEIKENHGALPFNLRYFEVSKARMGVKEMVEHDMLDQYPVLYEKTGEIVAQFKFTLLLLPLSTQNINEGFPLPFVSSALTYEQDEELVSIMNMSTQRKKRRRKR